MRLKDEKIELLPGESFRLLRWQDNVHDVEVVASDGSSRPFSGSGHEWHHHCPMELTLVAQGSGTRFVGDSITPFSAPDLVLIGPGLPHYWHMRPRSSGFALQFDFGAGHPFWSFPEAEAVRALWRDARRGLQFTGPCVPAVAGLIRTSLACGGLSRLSGFLKILDALSNAAPKHRKAISSTAFAPPARQATTLSLQKAINLVFRSFHEPLAFSDVLREAHMSKASFERHFKRHTGKTFTGFLSEVRLNFAGRQLVETDQPVSEIALASGYNNLSHFNHQFKALHRQSPRSFRRTMLTKGSHEPAGTGASPTSAQTS